MRDEDGARPQPCVRRRQRVPELARQPFAIRLGAALVRVGVDPIAAAAAHTGSCTVLQEARSSSTMTLLRRQGGSADLREHES